jgi:hypothetical protein
MIIKRNRPTPTNTTRKAIEGDGSPVADAQSEGKKSMPRLVKTEIPAQGLWTDRDGLCYWRRLKIQKYLL